MNIHPLLAFSSLLAASFCGFVQAETPPAAKMPWQEPSYNKDLPETRALSRPEPGEGGWDLWMKHHENRKQWVTENKVDLLMVGDSIVFGWSRVGKDIWQEYYADRNAVNIGSSGDRTYHMLWHFQNGGLDGMSEHNPKVVLVMMGTPSQRSRLPRLGRGHQAQVARTHGSPVNAPEQIPAPPNNP